MLPALVPAILASLVTVVLLWPDGRGGPRPPGEPFRSGTRIGRDHFASTVSTIAFAHAGAALSTLLLIDLYGRPFGRVVTSGRIAEEVVRTAVGSIGLILAIPVTTAVAAAAVARVRPAGRRPAPAEV